MSFFIKTTSTETKSSLEKSFYENKYVSENCSEENCPENKYIKNLKNVIIKAPVAIGSAIFLPYLVWQIVKCLFYILVFLVVLSLIYRIFFSDEYSSLKKEIKENYQKYICMIKEFIRNNFYGNECRNNYYD